MSHLSPHPLSPTVPPWRSEPGRFIWTSPNLTVTLEAADPRAEVAPLYRPELPVELPGASPFALWEWVRYKVTVTPPWPGLRIQCGDMPAESLGQGIYLFQYQNSLGASVIRFPGSSIPDLPVEVLSRKLASRAGIAGYAALYRRMVADVAEALVTLPFHLTGATVHGTARSAAPAGPFFAFHFFRRRAGELVAGLERISRAPHRCLSREEALRPVALARWADAVALRWSVAQPEEWEEAAAGPGGWLVGGGRRWLPRRLLQELPVETFNTPENRFVKHALRVFLRSAEAAEELAQKVAGGAEPGSGESLAAPLRAARAALQKAAAWPWLEEVGPMAYLPAHSQVLLRQDGYRELFQLYLEFLRARIPFWVGLDQAVAARNVAKLYEYWCFLRLVRLLGRVLGLPTLTWETDAAGGLREGLEATFAGAPYRLAYNRGFRGGGESYSVGLRPDFTLLGPGGRPEVAFDAKFRLDRPPPDLDDPGAAASRPEDQDIYKMHTYRDALGLRAAVALYPGDQAVFFDWRTRRRRSDVDIAEVVLSDLQGVGAIPLRPE